MANGNKPYTERSWYAMNIPKDRYVIDTRYFYQFAEGITGQSRSRTIYTTPEGFRTKTEARQFMKSIELKAYRRKGRKDYGYGSVGAKSLNIDIVPAGDIREGCYSYISRVYVYDEQEV